MIVLGIDTATRIAAVAVASEERVLAERSLPGARDLAATVFPLVEEVVAEAGIELGEIGLIAVSSGPGSFTGLRIGLSLTKGLAFSLGCVVIGVSTLEALASVAGPRDGTVCTVLDARKGEVYAALFDNRADAPRRLIEDRAITPEVLASELSGRCTLLGDGVDAYLEDWRSLLPQDAEFLHFSEFHPTGGAVARAGLRRYRESGPAALDALSPRYVRPPEAERKRLENDLHTRSKAKIDRVGSLG